MTWDLIGNLGIGSYLVLLIIAIVVRRFAGRNGTAVRILEAITGRPIVER